MTYQHIQLQEIIAIALEAGEAIMEIYARDFAVEVKGDQSPLTEADTRSNEIILSRLQALYPSIPYISEETKQTPYTIRQHWAQYWLIDPIDGTKEFIKKNGEFTVNIALVDAGVPVLGVVYAPALNLLYYAALGVGAFLRSAQQSDLRLSPSPHYSQKEQLVVVGSRSHLSDETLAFVEQLKAAAKQVEFANMGSSLKLCLVAEGKADVYPRFGPTMEWDTAAAHAVALYAGRQVLQAENGQPLRYNKENLLNPYFIVE
ncbi:MAG: 3'(2'),5'-bisphosphate nucleotidase CysQ [Bacteroidetes bacterium]|nr:3'(2'),5'-bisphosphate nucleotidase CysQ [Bacteroidota bacterium]